MLVVLALSTAVVGVQAASSAHEVQRTSLAQCKGNPWVKPAFQSSSTPAALGALVLQCLKLEDPSTYRHDEVGIVALVHSGRFQNINEFGLTSTVQVQLAKLGMPPITLEDGPGGLIVGSNPKPTQLPNELALGATFDPTVAAQYGALLGSEAHQMGYDGVQAPDLNLIRVPSWGRAFESFGESPVLAGEMGGAEAVAIANQGEIPVLKHFGPYSQDTDRHDLDQQVTQRAYQEVYIRPFVMALRDLIPQLDAGHHAVGIMCSYGNVNATRACRSQELAHVLGSVGVNALVRSDLDVWVEPSALLRSGIDLIKPMASVELTRHLIEHAVDVALDEAVTEVFTTEFADGLVDGRTAADFHVLTPTTVAIGAATANQVEERAAVLLKNDGILPFRRSSGPIAVLGDSRVRTTCAALASALENDVGTTSTCTDPKIPLPRQVLFDHVGYVRTPLTATKTVTFTAPLTGSFVTAVTTLDDTTLRVNGRLVVSTSGRSEFAVQRTALLELRKGVRYSFRLTWTGINPTLAVIDEQPMIDAAIDGVRGARAAVVIAYDLPREGMDRNSLALPNAQDALISTIAARVPTVVLLASSGAVTMPWLGAVHGLLEVWNPTGMVYTGATLTKFVDAYGYLLDGTVDPSGRLPVTFPVSAAQSPMSLRSFWPGVDHTVNLDLAPDGGIGIGYPWYRQAHWPVLFPFGYGLSYTSYQLVGGTVADTSSGLSLSVGVRDTGGVSGTEVVQVYADWPSSLGEPQDQLVGFGTVTFSPRDAELGTVRHATIAISPNALSVYQAGAMTVEPGSYCLEAATYDGDPHAWTTGSITLDASPGGAIGGPASTSLTSGTCPS